MSKNKNKQLDQIIKATDNYQAGFSTETTSFYQERKGLSVNILRNICYEKREPLWMFEIRKNALKEFKKAPDPSFGPKLDLKYHHYTFYIKATDEVKYTWDHVPTEIKKTFEALGIQEAEQKYLAGVSTQFESEVVYHHTIRELELQGVIFCDTDTALKKYPELFREYFGALVPPSDNKFAALNTAVWSGGSFIYVPPYVRIEKPLQSYFRINSELMGQFERTIIIVDQGAYLNYVEGCTAPRYSKDSLHAAVVEIYVKKGGYCRYSTIQNWSSNIINLVTKRAYVEEDGHMEWIDGNIGSKINMKYPACILAGPRAKGTTVSIAFASNLQYQDTGAKMIHLAPDTTSQIISKSICRNGGKVNYRGLVRHGSNATNAKSHVECDTLILDDISSSDTIPTNIVTNDSSYIEHEASVSKVSEEQLFYLMSRGLTKAQATEMIIMGFIEPFTKELPMEYAVELNQLIKLEMDGSIG